jgi:lipopolysaccharide transport system ATP-binding protein
MSDLAIRVENLSKQYTIGAAGRPQDSLRDYLADGVRALVSRNGHRSSVNGPRSSVIGHPSSVPGQPSTFWALKDVSFEVKHGEVLGIIGSNGAGKSTLLKILSRIVEPTCGRAEVRGKVGSLLEVGTGFDRELTGRENIYLSGAVLGMKKAEIDRRFDEIVEFSGVDKFIDTPVKRYSSGMFVRLAFGVAAHLEPEILIVDEVLAVGDAAFQNKCLGKMEEVRRSGRTVLFVSHNLAAIENLCSLVMLLDSGKVRLQGDSRQLINCYLETVLPSTLKGVPLAERTDRCGSGAIRLTSFHVEDAQGNRLAAARSGMDIVFVFGFQCRDGEKPKNVDMGFSIGDGGNQLLFVLYSSYVRQAFETIPAVGEFRCCVRRIPLSPGRYSVGARLTVGGEEADWPQNGVGYLEVENGDFYGTGKKGFEGSTPFLVTGQWRVQGKCRMR